MRDLLTYDPQHQSSEDEIGQGDDILLKPHKISREDISVVDERDGALLRLVVDAADKRQVDASDFSGLYSVFQAFQKANKVSSRTQCINILLKLCTYTELDDWTSRLEECLQDYSLMEYGERRDAELNQRLWYFRLLVKRRVLDTWVYKYDSKLEYFRMLEERAAERDSQSLLHEGLENWVHRVNVRRQKVYDADVYYEHVLATRHLNFWSERTRANRQRKLQMERFVMGKFFRRWHAKHDQICKMALLADETVVINTENKFFIDWRYKVLESGIENKYDTEVIRTAFGVWDDKTRRIQELDGIAEAAISDKVLRATVQIWKSRVQDNSDNEIKAIELRNRAILRHGMDAWKQAARVRRTGEPFEVKVEKRVLLNFFKKWTLRTKQIREANEFRKFMSLHQVFKQWRLGTRYGQVTRLRNMNLVKPVLRDWVLKERLQMFLRYQNSSLAVEALTAWTMKLGELDESLQIREAAANAIVERNKKHAGLENWIRKTATVFEDLREADDIHQESLKRMALDKMLGDVALRSSQRRTAIAFEYKSRCLKAFTQWKVKAQDKRENRLSSLLDQYTNARDGRLKSQALEVWFNVTIDMANFSETADSLYLARTQKLATKALQSMVKKLRSIRLQQSRADTLFENSAVSHMFTNWTARLEDVRQIARDQQFMREIEDIKTRERTLRQWRLRIFRLGSLQRDAERFQERLERERFKRLIKMWAAKLHEIQNSGSTTLTPLGSTTPVPVRLPYTDPQKQSLSLLESPSRVRSKKNIDPLALEKWHKLHNTPQRMAMLNSSRTASRFSQVPTTPVPGSKLRNQLFTTPIND